MHGGRGRPWKPLGRGCILVARPDADTADSPAPAKALREPQDKKCRESWEIMGGGVGLPGVAQKRKLKG